MATASPPERHRYIAHLEVLGTSDLARYDRESYYESLAAFHSNLIDKAGVLEGQVHFFSEAAFIESASPEGILTFIADVRSALLDRGYYLKGAVSTGTLQAKPASQVVPHPAGRKSAKSHPSTRVAGAAFGESVANVIDLHNTLRGIGIRLDPSADDLLDFGWKHRLLVQTCHFPEPESRHVEPLYDLRYRATDVQADEALKLLVRRFHQTNIRSKRLGRYYLTVFVSWIRSTDFTPAVKAMKNDADPYPSETPLVLKIALSDEFKGFRGASLVTLALVDQVYADTYKNGEERAKGALSQKVASSVVRRRSSFVNDLERIPEFILDKRTRRRIIDYLADRSHRG